ncbi:hypothetical protein ACFX2J_017639 [Malus domestica]|uniref:Uncharacterized protein n=1 Tax=Malus domestica TaxID=3750 RepID=A0A498HZL7_MALDO|nr:hypothetical protein DVH24_029292 [Malus domestica]
MATRLMSESCVQGIRKIDDHAHADKGTLWYSGKPANNEISFGKPDCVGKGGGAGGGGSHHKNKKDQGGSNSGGGFGGGNGKGIGGDQTLPATMGLVSLEVESSPELLGMELKGGNGRTQIDISKTGITESMLSEWRTRCSDMDFT